MMAVRLLFASMLGSLALCVQTSLAAPQQEAPPELRGQKFLFEISRHLYRWYMDEVDIERAAIGDTLDFGIRTLKPQLDPDDHSAFGEIVLPQFGVSVKVKKADYVIPELKAVVTSSTFRITGVARGVTIETNDYTEVKVSFAALKEYLFRTRRDAEFPDEALIARLRLAARDLVKRDFEQRQQPLPTGKQIMHLSPISPVANELWVFWETGRRLIRFSSDIDLANPAVWEHEHLNARIFNLDDQVVVSLDEVPGSNTFMTRDQAGRAIYNCVVLGRRLELIPPGDKASAETPAGDAQATPQK